MSAAVDGDELLARINPQLRRVRVQICLRPDLLDKWSEANEALAKAQARAVGGRLAGGSAPKAAAETVRAIEEEIEAASPWFEFEALPTEKFQALAAQHPPREGNQLDAMTGHNREAVANALVRDSMVDPTFSDEGWTAFKATCAPSQWAELRNAAVDANGQSVKPPKSRLASRVLGEPDSGSE